MLSFEYHRVIADEREREVQELIRIKRLLELHEEPERAAAPSDDGDPSYPEPWRARAPRASATTR